MTAKKSKMMYFVLVPFELNRTEIFPSKFQYVVSKGFRTRKDAKKYAACWSETAIVKAKKSDFRWKNNGR